MATCGEKQIAYMFLRKAVAENYCAHQALQSDPLLVKLRGSPEFDELLSAATGSYSDAKRSPKFYTD